MENHGVTRPFLFEMEDGQDSEYFLSDEETNLLPKDANTFTKLAHEAKPEFQHTLQSFQKGKKYLVKDLALLKVKHLQLLSENQDTQSENKDLKVVIENHKKVICVLSQDLKTQKEQYETQITRLRMVVHDLQATEESCKRNHCQKRELETCKQTIHDLEEKLGNQKMESDLLVAKTRELSATNTLLQNEVGLLRRGIQEIYKHIIIEGELHQRTIQDLKQQHRLEKEESDTKMNHLKTTIEDLNAIRALFEKDVGLLKLTVEETKSEMEMDKRTIRDLVEKHNHQNEKVELLKLTNEELIAAKTALESEMASQSTELETLKSTIQDQEKEIRFQKEEANAEIMRLKSAYDHLQTNISNSESKILSVLEEVEDKLTTQLRINCDNAELISKMRLERMRFLNTISTLEDRLRIQSEKN